MNLILLDPMQVNASLAHSIAQDTAGEMPNSSPHIPTVFTDPMVLNRPEDQLDAPGVLEQSMERGASNPHAGWDGGRRAN